MLEPVSNSGPFIHLNDINKLKLLNNFSKIFIPDKVAREIGHLLPGFINIKIIKVSPRETKSFNKKLSRFKLHEAEIDALYLAKKLNRTFFTDDLEARNAAKKLRIDVHGCIGVIVLCYKNGLINMSEAKRLINELYEKSSLFISKAIVDIAIEELSKH